MGSVKVDEIGVSVGQKERPNRLSVGPRSRSASDKKVVPCCIQDKIRIGSLIYRPDCRLETRSSSRDHHEPGMNRNSGWQLDFNQAYTIHTFTLLAHHRTLHLEKMYFQLSLSKECFIV